MAEDSGVILKEYGQIEISETRQVRALAVEWKKRKYIHLREFYLDKETNEFVPGKGLAIREENIVGLKRLLREIIKDHETFGILTKANGS